LKKEWGDLFLKIVAEHKPKHFLEIGVFCGVTARNVCELLEKIHGEKFQYTGVDLFGSDSSNKFNEKEPNYLKEQKFSNPLKNIYYNFFKKENLNSEKSVSNFLAKFSKNVKLLKGNSNKILQNIRLDAVDFAFIDGGHSFETVWNDINNVFKNIKRGGIIICDDYKDATYITGVQEGVDKFVKEKKLKLEIIKGRFAKIIKE
tara:strand:+ start:241 stop:849 length:609 start_codon:yes stop_codon:yes gene_type:complete